MALSTRSMRSSGKRRPSSDQSAPSTVRPGGLAGQAQQPVLAGAVADQPREQTAEQLAGAGDDIAAQPETDQ